LLTHKDIRHALLGYLQGDSSMRRPPDNADSTTRSGCGYAVRDDWQATMTCSRALFETLKMLTMLWLRCVQLMSRTHANRPAACGYMQVYENNQAYPEYVLWLTP
jgi:hypothetical protein